MLVFGADKESHDHALKSIFERIRSSGLSLNLKKCSFLQTKINFLGYEITNGTAKPDLTRTDPVLEFPLPTNVKTLGMCTYYSKYIPNFSNFSRPLYNKINYFDDWTDSEIKLFNEIKEAIKNSVLVLPTENEILHLRTDASDLSISAVLETDNRQPVYFCSRVLNQSERNYDIVEKEGLAIFWGITRLRSFLLGRKFIVHSDHRPLQYLFNNEKCAPKILRWKLQLQEYNFEVNYCKGSENKVADCLTRINVIDHIDGETFISETERFSLSSFSSVTLIRPSVIRCNVFTEPSSDSKHVRISFLTFSKLAIVF